MQRHLQKSVLHVQSFCFAYFLVSFMIVVALSPLVTLSRKTILVCDDLARKTDHLIENAPENRRP